MALVLGLGFWIAFGPASTPKFPLSRDAIRSDVLINETRGVLEAFRPPENPAGDYLFRLWLKDGNQRPATMTRAQIESLLGPTIVDRCLAGRNRVFQWLKITSWYSVVWVGIGFFGQIMFSGRMVLQWITSEKHRKSVITESFWWFSLIGGVTLFSYFVWRQDPVAILGQASGIVVYIRNIRLLRKHARKLARSSGAASLVAEGAGDPNGSVIEPKAAGARSDLSAQPAPVSSR